MKTNWLIALTLVAGLGLTVERPAPVRAATTITLRRPAVAHCLQPPISVYAMPAANQLTAPAVTKLNRQYQAMAPEQLNSAVAKLKSVTTLPPSQTTFAAVSGHAYLVVAQAKPEPFATKAWLGPAVIKARAGLTVSPKGSRVTFRPYFFKVDETGAPLAGAAFALTRWMAGRRDYLTATGWRPTAKRALTWSSRRSGLVVYTGPKLSPGNYAFKEVRAPRGYRISPTARHVALHVPTKGALQVNQVSLAPLVNGHVLAAMNRASGLAVVNMRGHPRMPNTAGQPPHQLWLPHAGEAKAALVGLGICLITGALWLWRRSRSTS